MSEAPQWLTSLVDAVGNCMEAHCATGPLAFRWGNEDDFWEVMVYCTPGEAVGGAEDGAVLVPGFSLDLMGLTSTLEELTDSHWQAHSFGPHDQEGPHISVEGVYQGHHVYLQVLAEAPEDEEPGFKVDLEGKQRHPFEADRLTVPFPVLRADWQSNGQPIRGSVDQTSANGYRTRSGLQG